MQKNEPQYGQTGATGGFGGISYCGLCLLIQSGLVKWFHCYCAWLVCFREIVAAISFRCRFESRSYVLGMLMLARIHCCVCTCLA